MSNNLLHDKAEQILALAESYPGLPSRKRHNVIFRLWSYPALSPYKSWTIIDEQGKFYVRRVIWNQRIITVDSSPVTYGTEVVIPEEIPVQLDQELKAIQLPVFEQVATMGIDGVMSGIEYGGSNGSARLSWWCSPPESWHSVEKWHREAIIELEKWLPKATVELAENAL